MWGTKAREIRHVCTAVGQSANVFEGRNNHVEAEGGAPSQGYLDLYLHMY